jgi:hypothetical protein
MEDENSADHSSPQSKEKESGATHVGHITKKAKSASTAGARRGSD